MNLLIGCVVVCILIYLSSVDGFPIFSQKENFVPLLIGNTHLSAHVADTTRTRKVGLSGLKILEKDNGLLFIFEKKGYYPFWMKEMFFPIDIIWIDEEKRITDITRHISPDTFPQTFVSRLPVRYVLEVNAGFVEENGISLGDHVAW